MAMQKNNIGEAGTEQFTVTTRVDGKLISEQPIHDPFVRTVVRHQMSRWEHFKAMFHPPVMKVLVMVDGSEGANRAIMTLDPVKLEQDTCDILEARRIIRETNGTMGFYQDQIIAKA